MKNFKSDNIMTTFKSNIKGNTIVALLLTIILTVSLSACSLTDLFEFQNESNTVEGTAALSERIDTEARNGTEEITLFVKDSSEDQIKNITDNMGLFWGVPTEYTIIKAIPDENTLKIKFFIEKSNNYYVLKSYLDSEQIPEGNTEAAAIDKELEPILNEIIKDGMTDYDKELAIHDWLVENVEYSGKIDASSTDNGSYGALVNKKTMCRGYAESMKLLSECCGLDTKVIVGSAIDQDGKKVGHAWNLINLDDKWYQLDVTYDDPVGDDSGETHYFYFNLNDTDMNKDHDWEAGYFPECDNDSYMYYKKNDLYYTNFSDFESGVKEIISYDKPDYVEVLLDAENVYESQIDFIFDVPTVKSITWNTHSSNPVIVCITPEYY